MTKNLLVAQSGGPTAAINSTLAGIIKRALEDKEIDVVYGARYGIQGVLSEQLINLDERLSELAANEGVEIDALIKRLSTTPAAALGSCRYKMKNPGDDTAEYERLLEIFRKYNIGSFIYIGGNDSMDTVAKLSEFLRIRGVSDINVVGAPKTIDNDLFGIDHCPGFGSAAKYITATLSELEREIEVYDGRYVLLVEMMGRNAGWLTAAASLCQGRNSDIPYLIYLQERPFSFEGFIEDLRDRMKEHKQVMVAVSEGIQDESGRMICEYLDKGGEKDAFGHSIASGAAGILEDAVKRELGCKTRSIELNLLQRCAGHLLSETDIREAYELGRNAVELALSGKSGVMSSLRRVEDISEYAVEYYAADIREIANREKKVPDEWITAEGNNVTEACVSYLRPLIRGELSSEFEDGLPVYLRL